MSASMLTQAPKKVRSHAAGMNLRQVFRIAWRAILGNPLRSVLTTLGVIIGVAAVVALTMVGRARPPTSPAACKAWAPTCSPLAATSGGGAGGLAWCALGAPRPSPWPMPKR